MLSKSQYAVALSRANAAYLEAKAVYLSAIQSKERSDALYYAMKAPGDIGRLDWLLTTHPTIELYCARRAAAEDAWNALQRANRRRNELELRGWRWI